MTLYLSQMQYTPGCLSEEIQQSALCKSYKTWIKLCMLTTRGQLVLYFMQNWPTWVSATLCGNADNVETIR